MLLATGRISLPCGRHRRLFVVLQALTASLLLLPISIPTAAALSFQSISSTVGNGLASAQSFSQFAGDSALQQVQWLGGRVAQKERAEQEQGTTSVRKNTTPSVNGSGGSEGLYNSHKQQLQQIQTDAPVRPAKERQVWEALANLEQDSTCCRLQQL